MPDAVTFDCFGTLVSVDRPDDPAAAVADELRRRGVAIPTDWPDLYATSHLDVPNGAELALPDHVEAALDAGGAEAAHDRVADAVLAAFDREATARPGAESAIAALDAPVGVCSNCSVPGLVERALERSGLRVHDFDAVVTSVDCGWRKPDHRAFAAAAEALGTTPDRLVHVGDDPATDGGVEAVGGRFVDVADASLAELAATPEGESWAE